MKRVIIKENILNQDVFVLDEHFYKTAVLARRNLLDTAFLEEKFDIVMENFNEYEECLLSLASQANIFRNISTERFNQNRSLLDRRIINLLASSSMYTDQAKVFFKKVFGKKSKELLSLESHMEAIRVENLGFRVCEYLRNYTQHYNIPINSLLVHRDYGKDGEDSVIGESIIPYIKLSILSEDKKFFDSIGTELIALTTGKDNFDVRPLIRQFVHGLGKIQEFIRSILETCLVEWETSFSKIFEIVKHNFIENSPNEILLATIDDESNISEPYWIGLQIIDHRNMLIQKNISQNNTHIGYATNQAKKKDFSC